MIGWSLVMAGLSILGLYLTTTSPDIGWRYSLAMQLPWAIYGLRTGQPGLVIMSVVFAGCYLRGLRRFRRTADGGLERRQPVRDAA